MTLRIFIEVRSAGSVVALHGWLGAAEVEEVERALARTGPSSKLDLTHLTGADAEGVAALRRLSERGTPVEGASPYMSLLLASRAAAGQGKTGK